MTVHKPGKSHRGIFGTPEEPIFNSPQCRDFPHLLQQSLLSLAAQNAFQIRSANDRQGLFWQGVSANFLFHVCEKLKLPYQVKFVAIELFDRFMQKHVDELYSHVLTSDTEWSKKPAEWRGILERVQKQLSLRIVSCCQIASKLNSHYKVISVPKARYFLLELGQNYTASSILQSELRILKTLGFRVRIASPLDYVETLLQVLAHNTERLDLPISVYQSVSVKLLTVLHLRCQHIYTALLSVVPGTQLSSSNSKRLNELRADKLLMGTSVIAAAAFISDQPHTDIVIQQLHRITQIPVDDMEDFVTVLVREVQSAV